jgi:LysR family transcriptional regulator, hca operon transcriptional activator
VIQKGAARSSSNGADRREDQIPGLAFKLLTKESLVVFLPSDHRLATHDTIRPQDIPRETIIGVPKTTSPAVIDDYAARTGIDLTPDHEVNIFDGELNDRIHAWPRLVAPLCAKSSSAIDRQGEAPTIDLVMGYNRANTSSLLKAFLSKVDDLIARGRGSILYVGSPEDLALRRQ